MKIQDIRYSELKMKFLDECLQVLRDNITVEEEFHNKKFKTGVGPNRHHFDRLKKINTDETDIAYWIYDKRIFQYHRQLEHVFAKYLYIMETRGI